MTMPTNLIDMGYVASPFGIQGWVKIKAATEYTDSLDEYENIYLRLPTKQLVETTIENSFVRDGIFHAKLSGVNDRDAAFALRGATVCVCRDDFPEPDDDEYYWADLIGLSVVNLQGEELGQVKELMETGANDVVVVSDGETKRLIPFVAQYIIDVSLDKKQITVDWGLDY